MPGAYGTLQVAPQFTPLGVEVTVPVPVPALLTVRVLGLRVKVAVTLWAALMGT